MRYRRGGTTGYVCVSELDRLGGWLGVRGLGPGPNLGTQRVDC